MDISKELLSFLLPELLITYFNIEDFKLENEDIHIYFSEKNKPPQVFKDRDLIGHGFYPEVTIKDFPLRGKTVLLHIKRRRWKDKTTQEIIKRDWDLVAKGSRMTNDFASFLKEINQY